MFTSVRQTIARSLIGVAYRVMPETMNKAKAQAEASQPKESRKARITFVYVQKTRAQKIKESAESTLRGVAKWTRAIAGLVAYMFVIMCAYALAYFALCLVLGVLIGVGNVILA